MILFAARGIIAGVFQAAYVYTPEVPLLPFLISNRFSDYSVFYCFFFLFKFFLYFNEFEHTATLHFKLVTILIFSLSQVYPTPLRSVGVGSCSAMARLGAMVTPYIAQVLVKTSLLLAVTVYGAAAIAAAIASYFLPYETSGKEMRETVHSRN